MTGTNLFPPGPIDSYVGQQVRFAFPAMAFLGVTAALLATIAQPNLSIVTIFVLFSSILGIVSTSIFDIIRTETAFKGGAGWASKILDGFRTNPASSTDRVVKLLGSSLGEVVIYVLLFCLTMSILCWIFWRRINFLQWRSSIYRKLQNVNKGIGIVLLIGISICTTSIARGRRNLERYEVYRGIYQFIDHSIGLDEKIAYLLSNRSYYFYGKSLRHYVMYFPSQTNSLLEWINSLKQKKVNFVAIGLLEAKMGWKERREIQWLVSQDKTFIKVFGRNPEKEAVIYRIKNN
jgi:hypothetical protein